jgi:DNA repair exonuclease SbcCD ATPase subunit
MTIVVNGSGIDGTINPDTPEWAEWFRSAPEGTKIIFEWLDDSCKKQKFTVYRRKRYWEAQKRVSRKLRNTTIKPENVTLEALRQVGYKLTAYNWADKFEDEKSGKAEECQTSEVGSFQTGEVEALKKQIEEMKSENDALRGRVSYLLDERGLTQAKANDDAKYEIERLQKLNEQLEKENHKLNQVYTQSEVISQKYHQRATELEGKLDKLQAIAKIIDLTSLRESTPDKREQEKIKSYQLRGEAVVHVKYLEKLGFILR